MDTPCAKCGTALATPWSFCPQCGLAATHKNATVKAHIDPEKSSVPGAFGGLLFGVIAAPILIIVGTLLCLTGLGAFLGIPMIIVAVAAPLAGPLIGIGEHKGKCPSCGTRIVSVTDGHAHCCPACDKEFVLGDSPMAKAG